MGGAGLVPDFRKSTVLVVDDNDFFRKLLDTMLRAFRVGNIIQCTDGESAFFEIKKSEIDCVITDWRMGPTDGLALARMIRTLPESPRPDMPIILCTAYTELDRILDARDAGVNEILVKPVSASHLYNKLAAGLFEPREFVSVATYIGPDRRRQDRAFNGEDRRKELSQEGIDQVMNEGAA